ncbi:MAG: alpha-D-glucose phosphate-specific phosphoglucomutase [Deltaproteobacteria bacterium]|nr:alpha-D-glucose phosphate-specific phosphoglucomutase [Deltaproteobacteria bacterium]
MALHPRAGYPAQPEILIDLAKLEHEYYARRPDLDDPRQLVSFGTSGHRGTSLDGSFNEAHILAITQAICDYRRINKIEGPLFMGKDTHALSGPAQRTALEVLAANRVETVIQEHEGFTPTPAISRAILVYNRANAQREADGIVVTPSHNPPEDGGFKYNPPHGGPADTDVTTWIQGRANVLLQEGAANIPRMSLEKVHGSVIRTYDFMSAYVKDLANVLDMEAIRASGLKLGVDPLGGAAVHYWEPIRDLYGLDLAIVNPRVDPAFGFMTIDHDGKIRMDCSSPYAMAGLVQLKERFAVAWANDTDADRHGIVTPSSGLMNPNHFLAVAIRYLLTHRPDWPGAAAIGKTMVSSRLIDRVVHQSGRRLLEVPVGFKWFVPGLFDGSCCFGGEESAGASFLRRNGTTWTTDKDGLLLGLLAAEITAVTGHDPGEHMRELCAEFGTSFYTRIDSPLRPEDRTRLAEIDSGAVRASELAGDPITSKLTQAPGDGAPLGGVKVETANGWFAVRPSGTENIYKIYAESFKDQAHLDEMVEQARQIVDDTLATV